MSAARGQAQRLSQILFSQGFGTRRTCEALVHAGRVIVDGRLCEDPDEMLQPEGLILTVEGRAWPVHDKAVILLNKPAGYECSQKPRHHPSVMTLLPPPLRERDVQPVGRLDEDTTGLLLLTDDGQLNHRLTSPKWHVDKVYRVQCKHPVTQEAVEQLLQGVVLEDDPSPVRAEGCEICDAHGLLLTIAEGRYHQVKRMLAAVGNRVERLHRERFGPLALPDDLPPGQWRWLNATERQALYELRKS